MPDSNIEWKKCTLFIPNEPKLYNCIFCKDRVHFTDDIPNDMNKYELELFDDFDISHPVVNIKNKVLDKFCGTLFTDYDKSDSLSDIIIANESYCATGKFLVTIPSIFTLKNILCIYNNISGIKAVG